jgi:hypothetical protein
MTSLKFGRDEPRHEFATMPLSYHTNEIMEISGSPLIEQTSSINQIRYFFASARF